MNEIMPKSDFCDRVATEVKALSNDALLERIHRLIIRTLEDLWDLACSVAEAKGRDLPMPEITGKYLTQLLLVANRQVPPALVQKWGTAYAVFNVVKALPYSDQVRLMEGGKLRVVTFTDGKRTNMLMSLDEIVSGGFTRQVFDCGTIRTEPEQNAYLAARKNLEEMKKVNRPKTIDGLKIDYEKGGAVCGKTFIPQHTLQSVLSALRNG